jgi:hypothetical protein
VADARRKLKIRQVSGTDPVTKADSQRVEAILARLVARAWAADHPELFGPNAVREMGESKE